MLNLHKLGLVAALIIRLKQQGQNTKVARRKRKKRKKKKRRVKPQRCYPLRLKFQKIVLTLHMVAVPMGRAQRKVNTSKVVISSRPTAVNLITVVVQMVPHQVCNAISS